MDTILDLTDLAHSVAEFAGAQSDFVLMRADEYAYLMEQVEGRSVRKRRRFRRARSVLAEAEVLWIDLDNFTFIDTDTFLDEPEPEADLPPLVVAHDGLPFEPTRVIPPPPTEAEMLRFEQHRRRFASHA